jgi:hypothetical protein
VWYIRDEWARDHKVFHPQWDVLYKSGVYASKAANLTPGGLPYAETSRLRLIVWLRVEQSILTVWQKSAEGIVSVATSPENQGGLTTLKARTVWRISKTKKRENNKPAEQLWLPFPEKGDCSTLAIRAENPAKPNS